MKCLSSALVWTFVISFVDCISIDGQLTVIKNDCYERMAIGEKLSPKQTYKTLQHNTVSKCEMECTREKEKCRAYSFGIGPKGNASCLLGHNPVKETVDLKPIGTISHTDYDLYIKKIDCQVVLEPPKHFINGNSLVPSTHHAGVANQQNPTHEQYENSPAQSTYQGAVSNPEQGYVYQKPAGTDKVQQVQTLVSIASGPQSVLHPVHDILVSGNTYHHSPGYGDKPPFRPAALNHPYDDHRPSQEEGYESPHRPSSTFDNSASRPESYRPSSGYDNTASRPDISYRPSNDFDHSAMRPESHRPSSGFDNAASRPDLSYRPSNDFDNSAMRPESHRPSSASRPDTSYTHSFDNDALRPDTAPYRPNSAYDNSDLGPQSHHRPSNAYDNPTLRPETSYDRPFYDNSAMRPSTNTNFETGYGQSSDNEFSRPHENNDRPDPTHGSRPSKLPQTGYGNGATQISVDRRKYESYSSYAQFETNSPNYNYYDHYDRPNSNYPNRYGSVIPHPNDYGKPDSHYDYLFVRPNAEPTYPGSDYDAQRPVNIGHSRPYDMQRPSRPYGSDDGRNPGYEKPPTKPSRDPTISSSKPPSTELTNHYGNVDYNKHYGKPGNYNNVKGSNKDQAIVTESVGYHGEKITSIITPLQNACFRRTMAGKRVVRGLVRKLLVCDTVEQCQQECGDERRFTCEGFNYRLDPTGRGKGECELIDLPLTRIDIVRETVRDPDYDFYVRDRNAAQVNCRQMPGGNQFYGGYDYGEGGNRRGDGSRTPYDRRPIEIGRPLTRPPDRWNGDYGDRRPQIPEDNRRPPLPEDHRRPDYGNRRGDYSLHHSHESHSSHSYHYNEHSLDRISDHHQQTRPIPGIHYLPASYEDRFIPLPPKKYPVIIPLDDPRYPKDPLPSRYPADYEKWGSYGDKYRYGLNRHYNYYIPPKPPKPDIPDDWGHYGGNYGNGVSLEYQGYHNKQTYNYWGFNKFNEERKPIDYGSDFLPPRRYLPTKKPPIAESYLPLPRPNNNGWSGGYDLDNNIYPLEPRKPDFVKDECSLRSATGFRLHKGIVKKFLFVPNIYECELLCVKEKEFPCASYAFRYTINPNVYNCYLSNRNYKELDYYTDVEPDRDFDIYTMNNRKRCQEPIVLLGRQHSDCFWRVRSGQRLDHTVVRDSLSVKSIVDCQLECLNSRRFTCRAYSFRYGSPVIGGAIDNCQLTDWPFYELDPKINFIPEPDFEVYERGSYGHGCEPDHFGIRGKIPPVRNNDKVDLLCYIGFGSAAKLLPRATIKSVYVLTELDCKVECSKARESVAFRCMSFSFVTDGPKIGHNCFLSDIVQRDLLPNVDYVHDPNSWLFTWDNYNPKCIELAYRPLSANNFDSHAGHSDNVLRENSYVGKYGLYYSSALDVWRVYSVSGWPCKRGTLCRENHEAGFWYCELEAGENNAWDYCCSPDHHCGFSNGYPYSWCYVGPTKTQWRKCNDEYYPYNHNALDRFDSDSRPWHTSGHLPPQPHTPGYRPDRPNAHPKPIPSKPTLDEYEEQFHNEFLSPPKPGGFGKPRRWPVAYLHKEMPPNATRIEKSSEKLSAIKSLIDVIKNTEIQNVQYHISNVSKHKADDVLYVKIPLPNFDDEFANVTTTQKPLNELSSNTSVNFEMVDTAREQTRVQKSLPLRQALPEFTTRKLFLGKRSQGRRGFVTRTNVTSIRKF